jgi:hypothetical protein
MHGHAAMSLVQPGPGDLVGPDRRGGQPLLTGRLRVELVLKQLPLHGPARGAEQGLPVGVCQARRRAGHLGEQVR